MSDAASIKVDILTINDDKRSVIGAWVEDVGQEPEDDETPDFESMTVTELKHRLRAITTERLPSKVSDPKLSFPFDGILPNGSLVLDTNGGPSTPPTVAENPKNIPPVKLNSLNSIVVEYLDKKGYKRSSAIFRAEAEDINGAQEASMLTSLASSSVSQPAELASKGTLGEGKSNGQHHETGQSKRPRMTALAETRRWRF